MASLSHACRAHRLWELQVETADEPGVDLIRGFRFPVVAGTPAPSAILRPGVQMRRALVAVVALAMAVYWIGSYRNWLRDKVDDPGTPPLTSAFVWHMLVLAAIAWQFL